MNIFTLHVLTVFFIFSPEFAALSLLLLIGRSTLDLLHLNDVIRALVGLNALLCVFQHTVASLKGNGFINVKGSLHYRRHDTAKHKFPGYRLNGESLTKATGEFSMFAIPLKIYCTFLDVP